MRAFLVQVVGLVGFVVGCWLSNPGVAGTSAVVVYVGLSLEGA